MKIYTKTGDTGNTSLVGGTRVLKSHPRVEAYGNVDELVSHFALLRVKIPDTQETFRRIQTNLMLGSAHLAADKQIDRLKNFEAGEIEFLEQQIDLMTSELPAQKSFIVPAGPESAACCHIARTVCRRAERAIVALEDRNEEVEKVLKYVNRLSDYLFTLSRYQCLKEGLTEDLWL